MTVRSPQHPLVGASNHHVLPERKGRGGIRTHDWLSHNGFAIRSLSPLGHTAGLKRTLSGAQLQTDGICGR